MKQPLLLLLSATFAIISPADGAASSSSEETAFTLTSLSLVPSSAGRFLLSNSSWSNDTSISSNDTSIPDELDEPDDLSTNLSSSNDTSSSSNETSIPDEPNDDTDEPVAVEPEEPNDDTYDRIMAMQNQTFAHQCSVALIDQGPFVWCDIVVPRNLNVTAEIRDGTCDEFDTIASSRFYTKGIAQPNFIPEVTEEEKLMGIFDHSYCARVDIFYNELNVTTGDVQQVSLLSGRFAMEITYQYNERVNEESGEIEEELSSATLSDENTKVEEGNKDLEIGLGVLAGAVVTLALVAIVYGKKKRPRRRRRQEENIEIAPMVASVNEENEII